MGRIGSDNSFSGNNRGGVIDEQGNSVVSASTAFGASPAGKSLLTQSLFGLANGTFDLLPPDPAAIIVANQNPLPYWDVQNISTMAGSAIYDATTLNWGINLNPGTAAAGDSITMTTRSYLINDDNLGLRQKAFAVVSKVGTYAGATQWNLAMTATYYDDTDLALGTATIGTIYDNTTWTSISGYTTTGGTAIGASASYVDLQFTLTATAAVTSATSVTIKSCLLSTKVGANSAFAVSDTFLANGTWTRPTGVNYVTVVAIGGGGGGAFTGVYTTRGSSGLQSTTGASGGGGSRCAILRDIYVGDVATVSVGIGAGGAGAGTVITKAANSTVYTVAGVAGAAGGATTFGSYLSVNGGGGGVGGVATGAGRAGGTVGAASTGNVVGISDFLGAPGGVSGTALTAASAPIAGGVEGATALPGQTSTIAAAGTAGSAGTATSTGTVTISSGTASAGGAAGFMGGGGSSGGTDNATTAIQANSAGSNGGGGAGAQKRIANTGATASVFTISSAGGNGAANTGAGGGSGGLVNCGWGTPGVHDNSTGTLTTTGGNGGSGVVIVAYVA
jgi:hypothetical protein